MPDYSLELASGAPQSRVAGIDEVGRGPLAGPVIAAALVFLEPPDETLSGMIDDSKRLSAARRQRVFDLLTGSDTIRIGLGAASVAEIDRINIGKACHLAMQRALCRLPVRPDFALVDGNRLPSLACDALAVVGGDRKSLSIAGASIVAKVVRDRLMTRLSLRHDSYGWERNAGYGTALHMAGLREAGVTPHHRREFAPIRAHMARMSQTAGAI
ncbi:ribonuclease HII [Swaminathania salitolerans]|uniref:Ribonuclease HII n=1 Tax=Swaminathania salitolerans TaxID=182838 RepID=A0A511BRV5_9PROT|nr:ribonuclease HII [Swaminathania salitolerans]GBQ14524.1 ribonuclease HII [Swaminathania salitolerans LMG 21291]GEL03071.1 ribonuclease HII [Swaminathania salitolerans]